LTAGFLVTAVRVGIQSFLRTAALPLRVMGARSEVFVVPVFVRRGVMPK